METTRLITGRRITARTVRDQKGLCSRAAILPKYGIRSALVRSPSRLSSAGRSVSAATTETSPAAIAPAARLLMTVLGTSRSPTIASVNAKPLNSTARLAVPPVAAIASSFSRP